MSFLAGRVLYYNDPATLPKGVLGLDILMYSCTLMAFAHEALAGRTSRFPAKCLLLFLMALFVEEASINNGIVWTHCHDDALFMITKCSSLNSVLYYVPWIYTALATAKRMNLPWWAYPSAVGMLQGLFGVPYEMQGPAFGWWKYTDQDVANGALTERIWGMPLMAAYFHPAMGWGVAMAETFTGYGRKASFFSWLMTLILSPIFALALDIPVRILTFLNVSKAVSVPILLISIFVFPVLLATLCAGRIQKKSWRKDTLLFSIPFLWSVYFVVVKAWDEQRGPVSHSVDMMALVCFASIFNILFHAIIDLNGVKSNVHEKTH
eukprot:CAMPEP_0114515310 /NCGR_PEP_ID=MMETSP0109-20121206/16664_1 /TAXON_ID=29199 /ORGANISM="Chlorarachnion reptans, Strain CCCM449" /LENGTH=321 /DNA_ID=CAMNT_0001695499 /DNA_START=5 /DNA_END=970 /DNA_ORIENTATION=-